MSAGLYPRGQHPFWCELLTDCGTNEDPHHLGRTSTMFGQSDEGRIQLQLVRPDEPVPAGLRPGTPRVMLTVNVGLDQVSIWLSANEAQMLAGLTAQYVGFLAHENAHGDASTTERILRDEMYAGERR